MLLSAKTMLWYGAPVRLLVLAWTSVAAGSLPPPRGFWPLDSVTQGADTSGNGGNIVFHDVSYDDGPFGNPGGSVVFHGNTGSYGTIKNNGSLDVNPLSTWMAWILDQGGASGAYFGYEAAPGSTDWSTVYWSAADGLFSTAYLEINTGGDWYPHLRNAITSKTDWVHIAASFDLGAGKAYVYVNGIRDDRFTQTVTGLGYESTNDAYMGRITHLSSEIRSISARMACMQLYDVALTAEQIIEAMDKCRPASVTIPKPKGFWMLDRQNQGKDLSGHGSDIVLKQTKNVVGPYGDAGGSMEFDGTANSTGTIVNNGALDVGLDMTWMTWYYDLSAQQGLIFGYTSNHLANLFGVYFFDCCSDISSLRYGFYENGRESNANTTWGNWDSSQNALGYYDGAWVHIAVTFDSTTRRSYGYRNGIKDSRWSKSMTGVSGAGLDTGGTVHIGRAPWSPSSDTRYLHARMACMQLYDEALTQVQILTAMEKCKMKPDVNQPTRYAIEATDCLANEYVTTNTTLSPRVVSFTVCYWLRIYKTITSPHIMMIYNDEAGEALDLSVQDGQYRLNINGVSSLLNANGSMTLDGNWHRECWTWESNSGHFTVYHQRSRGLHGWEQVGPVIHGKGSAIEKGHVVFLQAQGSELGGFDSSTCFYGILAGLEWWSSAKTLTQISALGCVQRGDVFSMSSDTVNIVGTFEGAFELAICCREQTKSSQADTNTDPSIVQATYNKVKGIKSASLPESSLYNVRKSVCVQSCLRAGTCDATSYTPSTGTCHLHSEDEEFIEDPENDYYSEWYYHEEVDSVLCPLVN